MGMLLFIGLTGDIWADCQPGWLKGFVSAGPRFCLNWKAACDTNPVGAAYGPDGTYTFDGMTPVTGKKLFGAGGYAGWRGGDGTKEGGDGRVSAGGRAAWDWTIESRRGWDSKHDAAPGDR